MYLSDFVSFEGFGDLPGYNVRAHGELSELHVIQDSIWVQLCAANVSIEHEGRSVPVEFPCELHSNAVSHLHGTHVDICYKHDDPSQAIVDLPRSIMSAAKPLGGEWDHPAFCTPDDFHSISKQITAFWILLFLFLLILGLQVMICCIAACKPTCDKSSDIELGSQESSTQPGSTL